MSSLLSLFPASTLPSFCLFPRLVLSLLLSQTCSHSSCLVLPSESQSVCKSPTLSLHLSSPTPPSHLPLSRSLWLYSNINMLSLIWREEGHMLFLAGGPQPAKLLVCVSHWSHNTVALRLSGTVREHGVFERWKERRETTGRGAWCHDPQQ